MHVKEILDALTFDDVLILPRFASVMPADVDITTRFSRNIRLNAPLCSSPMDTVTHHELAIQIALYGGIGIMDKHMPIEQQCQEVKQVKRHMSRIVTDPYTLFQDNTVADARNLMQEKRISGIPIIDTDGRLIGIITRHDLQFEKDGGLCIKNVMTTEHLITAPITVTPQEAQRQFHATHVEKLLLVDERFHLKGLMTLKDTEKKNMFPHATLCTRGQLLVGAAVGATGDFQDRAIALRDAGVDVIVIDASHGHSLNVVAALAALKKISGMVDIVPGNIATTEAAHLLYEHGADAVKVGIGPGSICTTRVITGAGVPQISAIMWVSEGVRGEIPVIADGGITYSGDITKALAAGASAVMIGSLFAATDESPGETIPFNGRLYKSYRGMGSEAVIRSGGDRYPGKAVPEGIEGMVPSKGPFASVFEQLIGGLRQGMGYAGCSNVEQLRNNTQFVRISHASLIESHPHGVMIRKEAPNYQIKQ